MKKRMTGAVTRVSCTIASYRYKQNIESPPFPLVQGQESSFLRAGMNCFESGNSREKNTLLRQGSLKCR